MVGRGLRTLADGLDHPDGVAWAPFEGAVYAGGETGQIYRIGVVANRCVQRVDRDGRVERYGDAIGGPNYPVFDADGRLCVSDNGSWEEANGGVVCIDPGGRTERFADGFRFSKRPRHSRRVALRC